MWLTSEAGDCAFIFVESSLHVGTGQSGTFVDQPLARGEATGQPIIPAGSLRGSLIAESAVRATREQVQWAFGTPPGQAVRTAMDW